MAAITDAQLTRLIEQLTPADQWLHGPAARPLTILPSATMVFDRGKEVSVESARVPRLKALAAQLGVNTEAEADAGAAATTAALRARLVRLGKRDFSQIAVDLISFNSAFPEQLLDTAYHETWAAIDVTNLTGKRCLEILAEKEFALDMNIATFTLPNSTCF